MQENTQENTKANTPIIKPSQTVWYMSITFFLVVGVTTVFFVVSSLMRWVDIGSINESIADTDRKIEVIGKDRKILIANIIKNNSLRPSLDLKPLIAGFRTAAAKANVRLKGFSIVDDVISTSLIATEWDSWVHPDPVATIIKMMREYAQNKNTFSLDPISSIGWDPKERTTAIKFRVLPTNVP